MPEFLTGVITPMVTGCDENGNLDEVAIRSTVRWLIDSGAVTSIFVRSGVGNMKSFTVEETKRMADMVVDEAEDDIYVLVGCSGDLSEGRPEEDKYIGESVELGTYAQEIGANGAVFVCFGLERTDNLGEKIYDYYHTLDESLDIPLVIYQPGYTPAPYRLDPQLLDRISSLPNVRGMKLSSNDMKLFTDLSSAVCDKDFTMICGAETAFLPALALGAGAVIGEGCNTYPQLLRALFDHFMEGELDEAAKCQLLVNKTLRVWESYSGSLVAKAYLARKGVEIEVTPRVKPSESSVEDKLDLFEKEIDEMVKPYRNM